MWDFPDLRDPELDARLDDLVALGADLDPQTLLAAYARGLFPMPDGRRLGWWSPVERGVLPAGALRVSRSLRQSCAHFEIRVDTAFTDVVAACASPTRSGGWIDDRIATAYAELHRLGHAHSVEAWDDEGLAGGLYGVSLGGLFAGESMFHRRRDASKAALVALVAMLDDGDSDVHSDGGRLLDVQWETPHLASLGVVSIPRAEYLRRLAVAVALPAPAFTPPAVWPPTR